MSDVCVVCKERPRAYGHYSKCGRCLRDAFERSVAAFDRLKEQKQ